MRREKNTCVGGFEVRSLSGAINHWQGMPGEDEAAVVAAKIQAAPGEDGALPDPQDEAQADATNHILESLGDGNYDNNIDQFWQDLESIQTWDQPSWIEPDRVDVPEVRDNIRLINGHDSNPAVLVNGRFLENGAAVLEKLEHGWSKSNDTLSSSPEPRIEVPTTVWVLQPRTTFAAESTRLNTEALVPQSYSAAMITFYTNLLSIRFVFGC